MMPIWINDRPKFHGARLASLVRGFSLIEMAVVMFIIVLLLGSILVPLATQVEQRQISDTEKTLSEIRDALVGFAVTNGYLPCPDKNSAGGSGTANDGVEDVTAATGVCVATSQGNVPWVTLGVGAQDVWGNRFRYQVTPAFSQRSPASTFTLTSAGTIRVCSATGCSANYTTDAIAIVISLGKNGYGAINAAGNTNSGPTTADEIENQTGPSQFMSRTRTTVDSAVGEFDDNVVWLSKHTLFNRMVAAGKLP
jgi:prepilin-type N-terminal cleavage/methylation domain-containing protein